MLVCVKKGKEAEITKIFKKWDLHGVVIGHVTSDKKLTVKHQGKVVAKITTEALAKAPLYDMAMSEPSDLKVMNKLDLKDVPQPKDLNKVLLDLLASPTITNKSWVYEQYDHMVQTNTTVLPGSDASVLRVKGKQWGIAATTDCNSRYCLLEPYRGAQIAVAEAARNLVCSGADPAAVTDCLNFGNPEKPDRYWYFVNCVKGIADACQAFGTPVISGNVSFYNESPKGAINPTPTIGMVGILPDIDKRVTQHYKDDGDVIILLGETKEELGGSEYLKLVHNKVAGQAPELDIKKEMAVQKTVYEAIQQGLIKSAHDCAEGGLAVALVESCVSDKNKPIGAQIDLSELEGWSSDRRDALLFGESQSRIIITCDLNDAPTIIALAEQNKILYNTIGKVGGDKFTIDDLVDLPLTRINQVWRKGLTQYV